MDIFLSMVSHELKQPLTVLRGNLQLAQRRVRRLAALPEALPPPELAVRLAPLEEQLTSMDRQTERQDELINDLLDAARIRTGALMVHPERANLLPLVRRAVEEQRQLAPERELWLDLPAIENIPVLADGRRIEQVVTNYLTNALKYSPASCPVEIGVTLEDRQARVWVRDQGPGLAPDQQPRIFERFYRAPGIEVQSGTGIGLGLGLYICRTIMEQQGGQVGVESTPGQGSTFWFTLPVGCPAEGNH
jgi:signal transduction histidine kinase